MIKKIVIEIKDQQLGLTLEEARDLFYDLNSLFGNSSTNITYPCIGTPPAYGIDTTFPTNPFDVTCEGKSEHDYSITGEDPNIGTRMIKTQGVG